MYSINRLIEDFPYTSSPNIHYNKEYIIYEGVLEKKKKNHIPYNKSWFLKFVIVLCDHLCFITSVYTLIKTLYYLNFKKFEILLQLKFYFQNFQIM